MQFKIGSKTYTLDYIQQTLGQPNYSDYTIEELLKMNRTKLREMLREIKGMENIPAKWRKDEVIIAILYAHKGKCNHIRTNENGDFIGFCKRKPSGKNGGNGRCDLMGGIKPKGSKSKRKDSGTPKDMTGNDNSLTTGVYYTGKAFIPKTQIEIFEEIKKRMGVDDEFLKKYPRIGMLMNRLCFLEANLQFVLEQRGLEIVNPDEYEKETIKTEDYNRDNFTFETVPFNPMFFTNYNDKTTYKEKRINKKQMTWKQYLETTALIGKLGLDIEKAIREAEKLNGDNIEQDFDYIPVRYRDSHEGDANE